MSVERVSIHGHELAVRREGQGPALLLLHGMASSSESWRYVVPELAQRFTVIAPDLLGHGASAKPRDDYTLGAHANLMRDLLTVLGYPRATIFGHSYGGGVAMQTAYQYPDSCERLVLVGSGGLGREVNPLLRTLTLPGVEQLFPLVCSPRLRQTAGRIAGWLGRRGLRTSVVGEEIWRGYASLADEAGRRAFFRTLRAVIDADGQSVSARNRLYLAAHVPTLIVWGEDDRIIPVDHAHEAHRAMPNSRLELFAGVGHYPHCVEPARFVAIVTEFIESTAAARVSQAALSELLRQPAPPSQPTQGLSPDVAT